MKECENYNFQNELNEIKKLSFKTPIVIGGCGRSGTTLLLSILGAHPEIKVFDEELYCFYPKPYRLKILLNELKNNNYKNKIWCEKTPKNILNFENIYKWFDGNIKLIHIIRDCRDVITSHHPNHKKKYWISIDRWINDNSIELNKNIRNKIYLLKYEDLVRDTKNTLINLCQYLNIDFSENLLNHSQFTNFKGNVSLKNKIPEKIYNKSIKKWENEEHKEIIEEFKKNEEALKLMKFYSYPI
jgi:hypothetical protein